MILRREIEKQAEANKVAKSTIDKDWVLSHFIDAIYAIPQCQESLIFKGGTCLRKCYFPNYRFSEDLDFTSIDTDFELNAKLLEEIKGLITGRTEIPLHIESLSELRSGNELTGYDAKIKFWGADHSRNQPPPSADRWTTSVKMEVILYEKMVFPVEKRKVHHQYSDGLSEKPLEVPCYSLQEVLAEKLRSLIQRSYTAPRDIYDIWYLTRHSDQIDWNAVVAAFYEKMQFKSLVFTGIDQMLNEENDKRLKTAWESSLAHQVPKEEMVDYEEVKKELHLLLNQLF